MTNNPVRLFLYRIKSRVLGPEAKAITASVYPDEFGRPRVLLLVSNPVDYDSRVKKIAASLRDNGYAVGILGTTSKAAVHTYTDPGLARVAFVKHFSQVYFRSQRRSIKRLEAKAAQMMKRATAFASASNSPELQYHDVHLEGLSNRRTILGKLFWIVRQRMKLRHALNIQLRADRASKRAQALRSKIELRKLQQRAQMADRRSAYYRISQVAKHWDFYRTFKPHIASFKPDIIHANDLLTLPAAIRYKTKRDPTVQVIYDAHELEMHRNKTYDFWRILGDQLAEWMFIRKADRVITVSHGIAEELARSYGIVRPDVVLNSPALGNLSEAPALRELLQIGPSDKVVAYVGAVTFGRGLETFVDSLRYLPDDYHAVVVGPRRPDKDQPLLDRAARHGVSRRFHLVEPLRPNQLPSFLSGADISINPSIRACLSYDLALPNKLFDAVIARVPTLVQELREMKAFVEATRTGIARDLGTARKTAAGIRELIELKDSGFFAETDWAGVAKKYSWEAQEQILIGIYAQLSAARSVGSPAAANTAVGLLHQS